MYPDNGLDVGLTIPMLRVDETTPLIENFAIQKQRSPPQLSLKPAQLKQTIRLTLCVYMGSDCSCINSNQSLRS